MPVAQIVIAALGIIAQALPGFLASFTGSADDAAALDKARHAIAAIPHHPALDGINRWRDEEVDEITQELPIGPAAQRKR